tara:strand:+ start:644 stop:835 length:192 start_codon:yes stop_codon:yes gene_type:complete
MTGDIISQYGIPQSREAFIFRNRKGFYVELYKQMMLIRVVECFEHSQSYAENVAENWVERILN